ncbi:MAG: transaldolase [Synechococcales bacterium]|nr:transaldolase [Synechococcales bacterium]
MAENPVKQARKEGQSIWLDYLNREDLASGKLKSMIDEYALGGLTSNPTIFEKAINGGDAYDESIEAGIRENKSPSEIYDSLIFEDIRNACDLFRPIYEETDGQDGYVSIEVSPDLARDTQGTIEEARRFYKEVERPNVMIKIPGTPEGMAAIEQAIAEGINVNITLLFSVDSYRETAYAYLRGLERLVQEGQPINKIASVASFFLSRIDSKVDDRIDERLKQEGTETLNEEARLRQIKGDVAIANAKIAYQVFEEIMASDRWQKLAKKGANVQRLLWASTSTKSPAYRDVMYVEELIGPHTVNTMPVETLEAFVDHGKVEPNRVKHQVEEAHKLLDSLNDPDININLDEVMDELLEEGIEKFRKPFHSLMDSLKQKIDRLAPTS